nr:immunoglobulin light chain junction region [Macaca mulatta]
CSAWDNTLSAVLV